MGLSCVSRSNASSLSSKGKDPLKKRVDSNDKVRKKSSDFKSLSTYEIKKPENNFWAHKPISRKELQSNTSVLWFEERELCKDPETLTDREFCPDTRVKNKLNKFEKYWIIKKRKQGKAVNLQ